MFQVDGVELNCLFLRLSHWGFGASVVFLVSLNLPLTICQAYGIRHMTYGLEDYACDRFRTQ